MVNGLGPIIRFLKVSWVGVWEGGGQAHDGKITQES